MNPTNKAKFHTVADVSKITPKDRFLRLPDVERLTGFKKSTLYNWIKDGSFPPAMNLGRMSAWPESAVMQWIENKKTGHEASYVTNSISKTNSTTEVAANAKARQSIASAALQGLLSNPNLKNEILKTGGAHSGWIESSAVAFADALIEELKK